MPTTELPGAGAESVAAVAAHVEEARAYLDRARQHGIPLRAAVLFGSAIARDIRKKGDLDLLLLLAPEGTRTLYDDLLCVGAAHAEEWRERSSFDHAPLVLCEQGIGLFSATAALAVLAKHAILLGGGPEVRRALGRHLRCRLGVLPSSLYWELTAICGDILSAAADCTAALVDGGGTQRFWARTRRRLLDMAFHGARILEWLRTGRWIAQNVDAIQHVASLAGRAPGPGVPWLQVAGRELWDSGFAREVFCGLVRGVEALQRQGCSAAAPADWAPTRRGSTHPP